MQTEFTIEQLLELNHLDKGLAETLGMLNVCPYCEQEMIRHTVLDSWNCLMVLAKHKRIFKRQLKKHEAEEIQRRS